MEIVLNLAWALCSIGLIGYWWRSRASNPRPLAAQLFALGMVVLLLLPVISLSDDLLAMQGAFEADRSVRRILHENHAQSTTTPSFPALWRDITASIASFHRRQELVHIQTPARVTTLVSRSYANRPPPQA
ncbi:MAG TPA: hypothetical protein VL346_12000 [Acidobacteriaceae bacterium]|nr:hypothetical protein [Acidobacteriaceae bacterium]